LPEQSRREKISGLGFNDNPAPKLSIRQTSIFARFGAKNTSDLFGGKAEPNLTFLDLGTSLVHPALTFSSQTK